MGHFREGAENLDRRVAGRLAVIDQPVTARLLNRAMHIHRRAHEQQMRFQIIGHLIAAQRPHPEITGILEMRITDGEGKTGVDAFENIA